jgi:hypothetical protein
MRFRSSLACSLLLIAAVPSAHHSQYLFTWAMKTHDPADTMPAASSAAVPHGSVFSNN